MRASFFGIFVMLSFLCGLFVCMWTNFNVLVDLAHLTYVHVHSSVHSGNGFLSANEKNNVHEQVDVTKCVVNHFVVIFG